MWKSRFSAVDELLEVAFELLEDLLFAEVLDGVATGGGTEMGAEGGVVDEALDGGVESFLVFGGDDEAAGVFRGVAADDVGDLSAGLGGGDNGTAAGEHAGELGRHDEVGGTGSLRKEVDVGGVEEVVEESERLQREQGYIGAAGDEGFELRAEGSVAAEEEVDAGIVVGAARGEGVGEGGEELEALLGAHVAGVEEDDFGVFARGGEIQLAAEVVARIFLRVLWVDGVDVDPVGKEDGLVGGNAFGEGTLDHLEGDAGDAVEGAGEEGFESDGEGVDGAVGGEQAEVEGGVDLEVLDVEPGGCAGGFGDEESERGAEEGGFDVEDDLWLPPGLAQHDGKAAEHEGEEVRHALEAGGFGRDVEGGAVDDGFAGDFFGAVEGATVVFADAPGGIVRGSGDDADVVAAGCEPGGHFAGVFADAGKFGGVIETVDQDSQIGPFDIHHTERGCASLFAGYAGRG